MVIKDTELFTQDNAVMRAIYTAYRQPRVLLATNVRDEDNILEWVSYHQKLGFDRVLILDHQSKVSVQRLLESHNLMKNVIVMPQPIQNHYLMKRDFLNVAVTYAKSHHFTWMLYIDGDEYLYLKNEIPDVQTFLTRFPPEASVIAVNWLIFGSNGKHDADCAALIPTFLKSDAKFDPHVKSFVRPEKSIGECNCGHSYTIANEKKCVFDVRGKLLGRSDSSFPTSLPIEDAPAFIAHYQMQSYSRYLRNRIHLPRDDTGEFRAQMSEIDFHALHNDRDNMLMLKRQKKHQSPDLLHS